MRFRVALVVVSISAFVGCSSSSSSDSGSNPVGSDDAGSSGADGGASSSDSGSTVDPTSGWVITDALTVRVNVYCMLGSGQTTDDCTTRQQVVVYDTHTTSNIGDAIVTVSLDGQSPVPLTYDGGMQVYTYSSPKFPRTYRYDVARGSDHAVVTGTEPADFTIMLAPSAPTVGAAASLTWTPTHDPLTDSWGINIEGTDVGNPAMTSDTVTDDDGSYALPTNSFPQAGAYAVSLYKGGHQNLYGPTQLSEEEIAILLTHELDVTAH